MNEILFSIIVPCYNVQDYLEECIKSIQAQTYRNYEVILIDDGSTDSTPQLCDWFGAFDGKIHVYHKENGGLSDARNYGMDRAKGDYFLFVDADDFIAENALNNFKECIQKIYPDVLLTRLTEYYGDGDIVEQDEQMEAFFRDGVSLEKALLWELKKSKSTWPAQKKVLSRIFIESYNLRFLKGFLHEDVDWSSRVMMYAEKFGECSVPWYYHRMQRKGSITNTISSKRITDVIEMSAMLIKDKEMCLISDERRKLITDRLMRSVYPMLSFYKQLPPDGKEKVVNCCKANRKLFRLAPNVKYRFFSLSARMFGFRVSLNLMEFVGGNLWNRLYQ
ncbi:glycosyltransferase family A protein [Clostridium sp. MCC353]|uniref:glycosyltransferase family 2 protein n=1 Tax=Clostridium sp. MCC353 TaxID=2592646 RepID=UPI001C02F76E|nr:glycosyltransferase family A protein [Clostridium sp. MCC353]